MVVGNLTESTEIAIIGAGPGGYVAAIRLAQLGKEVTLIDQEATPGGVCLLRGCIPSKALIEATKLFQKIKSSESMGILVENPRVDFAKLQTWKDQVTQKLGKGVAQLLKQNAVTYLQGTAKFLDAKSLQIQTEQGLSQLNFEQAIIATGSRPRELKDFAFDGESILSSRHVLSLSEVPKSLLVIGGGYIGLELGSVYAALGAQVTIVEATDSLLPGIDKDLLRPLKKKLKEMGVMVKLQTLAKAYEKQSENLVVTLKDFQNTEEQINVEKILVSIGRQASTENLNLEKLGVSLNEQGFIQVDESGKTSVPHIWAIGDVCGGMMLAHKASREAKVVAANIAGQKDAFDNLVPAVIFTDPEIAYVGLQEQEAKAQGLEVVTGMFPFAALGRAQTMEETEGFVKVVAEKGSERLLGVQMVGPHVSDLISEATLGIEMGARLEDFALTIHPHPTLPEALEEAMESALGIPIHRYQRK